MTRHIGGGWTAAREDGEAVFRNGNLRLALGGALAAGMLRDVREARGLTQEQLAQRTGISQRAISGYETGTRRPLRGLYRQALTDWLLFDGGPGARPRLPTQKRLPEP